MIHIAQSSDASHLASARRYYLAAAFLIVAIVGGGGGTPTPEPEIAIELSAIILLGALILFPKTFGLPDAMPPHDRGLTILCVTLVAIPLLHMLPLPPKIWHSLPGREDLVIALSAGGHADLWKPLSFAPDRTLASLVSLIAPLAMLFVVRLLAPLARLALLIPLVMVAILAAIVGALQLLSNGTIGGFYPTHDGYAVGFQANRNSAADVYLIGLIAMTTIVSVWPEHINTLVRRISVASIALLLAVAVLLTGSRTGTVLLLPVAAGAAFMLPIWKRRRLGSLIIGMLSVLSLSAVFAASVPMLERTIDRFMLSDGGRLAMWEDAIYQIRQTGLMGSGVGTGSIMLISAEPLNSVDQFFPNRVHNDYLEWVLETGILGIMLLVGALIYVIRRLCFAFQDCVSVTTRASSYFAGMTIVVLAFHSIVDYPLRSLSVACLFALALGLASDHGKIRNS